jgi:hypothetical protein
VFVAEASPITGPSRAPSLGGSRPNCLCHRSHLRFTTRTGHFADFARADYSEKCDGRWILFLNCHWQSNPRVVDAHHAPFALAQPVITTVTLGLYFHTPMHLSSRQTIGLPLFQAKRLRRDYRRVTPSSMASSALPAYLLAQDCQCYTHFMCVSLGLRHNEVATTYVNLLMNSILSPI